MYNETHRRLTKCDNFAQISLLAESAFFYDGLQKMAHSSSTVRFNGHQTPSIRDNNISDEDVKPSYSEQLLCELSKYC